MVARMEGETGENGVLLTETLPEDQLQDRTNLSETPPTKSAQDWKEEGNAAFSNKKYKEAAVAYQNGLLACSDPALKVNLLSNRAMVFLKLKEFEAAEEHCSVVLEEMNVTDNAKVWYRRALAREERGLKESNRELLLAAQSDLRSSLELLENTSTTTSAKESNNMKRAVQLVQDRLSKTLQQTPAEPKTRPKPPPQCRSSALPDPGQQRQDVVRLLLSRQIGLQNKQASGEALFFVDWDWWCDWCQYVNFFYNDKAKEAKLLSYLPSGAVLPTEEDINDGEQGLQPPGVIDNSDLFLLPPKEVSTTEHVFYQQWYQPYRTSDTTHIALRPNLVRGYHYELLPREVYSALRSWYGEATPSACRRTTADTRLSLYPLFDEAPTPPPNSSHCSACRAPHVTMRCKRCMSVYYCDRGCQESHWMFHKLECKHLAAQEGGGVPVPVADGRVGLNNLGNTCFMNSALQCLSHATPLTRHFLSNKFRLDLNPSNPLGTGGKLAYAYENVIKDLWWKRVGSSTSPTALKRAIALFAPRFAGCLQHDAQEFLAYLLDGLHEDLNRIRKKPYVEMPDIDNNHNMAVAGAQAWDALCRRDDSYVMDTFYGQFKSTCVCPRCNRVSVSFDAFNHVSLQIPQRNNEVVPFPVLVFRASSAGSPVRYAVEMSRASQMADLKQELSKLCGIPATRLVFCDVFEHQIVDMLDDRKPLSALRPNDLIVAYEVDPFSTSSFHVLASHSLISPKVGDNGEVEAWDRELFGFPFMTSFPAESTCRQTWDYIWSLVEPMVADPDASEEKVALRDRNLKIRLVSGRGRPLAVFPETEAEVTSPENDESSKDDPTSSSILPRADDEKLVSYLGEKSVDNFVFVNLEWQDVSGGEEEEAKAEPCINEDRFLQFENHSSWTEAVRKQKAKNGAKAVTLDQCFEIFIKPERLDENNMWYCSNCKEHVRAMKTMELWKLPNVLIVHLKRFEFKHILRRDKLDTLVDFPLEGLDMGVHCASANQNTFADEQVPAVYDLFAVVNHFGRMGFGHYTAFARKWDETDISDDWALFDDSSVRSVGDGQGQGGSKVVSPAAYVLFYRRRTFN